MKIVLLVILGLVMVVIFFLVFIFKNRLGKPVNEMLSDSYYFNPKGNKIIYSPMGNWFELGYSEIDADVETFQVVSRYFGKDKKTVYWQGKPTQADPSSFVVVSPRQIPMDKAHVYFPVDYPNSLFVVEGADPKTYEPLPILNELYYHYWDQDAYSIFLDGKKVDADRATFVRLNPFIATDTSFVYSIESSGTIEVGHPSATILVRRDKKPDGEATAINKNYVRIGETIAHADWRNKFMLLPFNKINSIKLIDERNIVVNGKIISDGKIMEDVDAGSFEVVDQNFFKDKKSVYYETEKILLANPQTFVVVSHEYSKDDQRVFYKREELKGAKPNTFTINFGSGIATDGNLSFKDGQLVEKKN